MQCVSPLIAWKFGDLWLEGAKDSWNIPIFNFHLEQVVLLVIYHSSKTLIMIAVVVSMAPPSQLPASFLRKQCNSHISFKFTCQFPISTQPVLLPEESEMNTQVLFLLALFHIFSAQDCLWGVGRCGVLSYCAGKKLTTQRHAGWQERLSWFWGVWRRALSYLKGLPGAVLAPRGSAALPFSSWNFHDLRSFFTFRISPTNSLFQLPSKNIYTDKALTFIMLR